MTHTRNRKVRNSLAHINMALIVALMLSLILSTFATERVYAQGLAGEVSYVVLPGQTLNIYGTDNASTQVIGTVGTGEFKQDGEQLANGWYKLHNPGAVDWYFYADPLIVTVTFTASTPGGGGGNQDGGADSNIPLANSLEGGKIASLPDIVKPVVFPVVFMLIILAMYLYFAEAIKDERFQLLMIALGGLVVIAITTGLLAYVNSRNGESCLENVVCFGSSNVSWLISGALVIEYIAVFIILYVAGKGDVKPGSLSKEEGTAIYDGPEHGYGEFADEKIKDGMLPTAPKPVRKVGKDAGNLYMTFVEMEEAIHREGGPAVVVTIIIFLAFLGAAMVGQAYFGPLHFRSVSEPSAGFSLAAVPFYLFAFGMWIQAFIEAVVENHGKKTWHWLLWFVGWLLAILLPFVPPLLVLGAFHGISITASGGMKEFNRGHSDLIGLTIITILALAILGQVWTIGLGGPIWQNDFLITSWDSWAGAKLLPTR